MVGRDRRGGAAVLGDVPLVAAVHAEAARASPGAAQARTGADDPEDATGWDPTQAPPFDVRAEGTLRGVAAAAARQIEVEAPQLVRSCRRGCRAVVSLQRWSKSDGLVPNPIAASKNKNQHTATPEASQCQSRLRSAC